jgi:adenine C2-methylase RlmN of 23S rRNA A2503 and tRNA A37
MVIFHSFLYVYQKVKNIKSKERIHFHPGEPLENYEAVASAIRGLVDPMRFGLAPSSVCLG